MHRNLPPTIIEYRKIKVITSTIELAELIRKLIPPSKSKKIKINPATKTFQALRIYVNNELNELKIALEKSKNYLHPKASF